MPNMPEIPEGARLLGVLYEKPTDDPDEFTYGLVAADGVLLVEAMSGAAAVLAATVRRWCFELRRQREQDEETPSQDERAEEAGTCE